jgi:hypothetical protein
MSSESESSYEDYNTTEILNQYENIMNSKKERSHSTDDFTKLNDEYDKLSMKSMKQQLKESSAIPNSNTRHKSMIKKKKTSARNKKKVGFHDDIHLIIDEQTSFRTRSVSLSKLSNGSDDISLKNILDAHQKYHVIDKLVFRIASVNWNG